MILFILSKSAGVNAQKNESTLMGSHSHEDIDYRTSFDGSDSTDEDELVWEIMGVWGNTALPSLAE